MAKFMEYLIPFGKKDVIFSLSDNLNIDYIVPKNVPGSKISYEEIKDKINISSKEIIDTNTKIAIAINDLTRPVPNDLMIPPLLEKLLELGIQPENISLIIATGTHTPLTPLEISSLLPKNIIDKFKVISHDCDLKESLVYLGKTKIGTPVRINRHFVDSDIKIVTGNIEPHHFMGYSGGVKSAAIGLAARETITANHELIKHPKSFIGIFDENPMRQDVEEIGKLIGIDYALNSVLNHQKEIIEVFWGHPYDVMISGISRSRQICEMAIRKKYDLVITSPGEHPKDINLYQAQKAITHASLIANNGAIIILVAACPQGSGSSLFQEEFAGKYSFQEVIDSFEQKPFTIGPHKAYQLALQGVQFDIFLVSKMNGDQAANFLLDPYTTLKDAISAALSKLPKKPKIAILPYATNTIASSK